MTTPQADTVERNLGEQPIAGILRTTGLSPHDLVAAAPEPITHKMVARACRGRRLTPHSQRKILNALNHTGKGTFKLAELFTYGLPHEHRE